MITPIALNSLFKSRFFWRSLPKRGTQTFYFYFYLNFHQRRRPTEVHKYSISISIQIFTDGGGPRRYTNNFKQDFSESRLKSCDFKKINFFCWILDLGSSAELQKKITNGARRGTQIFYFYFYSDFHRRRRPTEVHKHSISISI